MTFPKAYHGVKKLFTAQLLKLIASVCSVIMVVVAAGAAVSLIGGSEAGLAVTGLGTVILMAAILVLPIVGLIIELVGLKQAAHDDDCFQNAFIVAIFALILTVVTAILGAFNVANGIADNIASVFVGIANIVVVFYVAQGISNLADQLKQDAIAGASSKIIILYTVVYAVSILANFVVIFFGANTVTATIVMILSIVSPVFSFVASIIYLVYLGRAKNMLRDH